MVHKLYSLYDRKMESFGPPTPSTNDAGVRRGILDAMRGGDSLLNRYPSDFDLYCVGLFDDETGEIAQETPTPRLVCNCGEVS